MEDLIGAVGDMAKEEVDGKPTCEAFRREGLNYKNLKKAIMNLKDKRKTMMVYDHNLYYNWQNIDMEGQWMAAEYKKQDWDMLGYAFGKTITDREDGECPVIRVGAKFAHGFFKGVKLGDIDEGRLADCLNSEPSADKIFFQASLMLKASEHLHNPELGVKGLDDMVRFVVDMATEKVMGKIPKCEFLQSKDLNWKELGIAVKELRDPKTTLRVYHDHFYFNRQNIDREAEWMGKSVEMD